MRSQYRTSSITGVITVEANICKMNFADELCPPDYVIGRLFNLSLAA